MIDQAKYTDEGWWGNAATAHFLTGHWYVAGDYNPAVALPMWPLLLGLVFHFTGVGIVVARAVNVAVSIATLAVVYLLVRRVAKSKTPAIIAVLLVAASPIAFVFNRLAILETPIVFQFCLALLIASYASVRRIWVLIALATLITAIALTKTTGLLLAAPVLWMAWWSMGRTFWGLVKVVTAVGLVPLALVKVYELVVSKMGYGGDYRYFFDVNAMPDIDWKQTYSSLHDLFQNCFWIDRVLFPVCLLILVMSWMGKGKLWTNPLFVASWIVLGLQAVFIFSRQDDYAPRYFLVMVIPLMLVVTLTLDELMRRVKWAAAMLMIVIIVSVVLNVAMIDEFWRQRSFDYRDAAASIRNIVRGNAKQKALMVGVSGSQLSLMTGIPSISDGLGTEDMKEKMDRYQPGWYVEWSDVSGEDKSFLSAYQLEKVSDYSVFDDDDRSRLALYKLVPKVGRH